MENIELPGRPDLSPEQKLEKQKEGLTKQKENTTNNIEKLTKRLKEAVGAEKERLAKLVELHTSHKAHLDTISFEPPTVAGLEELS